jgi:hypothetical protein
MRGGEPQFRGAIQSSRAQGTAGVPKGAVMKPLLVSLPKPFLGGSTLESGLWSLESGVWIHDPPALNQSMLAFITGQMWIDTPSLTSGFGSLTCWFLEA